MQRSVAEIDKLIGEWEALRMDYAARGATGIVNFIDAEIRKLRHERDTVTASQPPALKPTA